MKGKRAGLPDMVFFIVAIFAVGLIFLVGWHLMKNIDDTMQSSNAINDQGKTVFSDLRNRYAAIIDNAFLFMFIGVLIGTVAGAFFIRTHPALFWVSLPIMIFFIFLAAIYSNFFSAFAGTSDFAGDIVDLPIISFILNHYVFFIGGAILIISIALFAKSPEGEYR